MNNFRLNIQLDSLSDLTEITPGSNMYRLEAELRKPDGSLLNSPYIPSIYTTDVQITNTNFFFDIPMDDVDFTALGTRVRLYNMTGATRSCCFARINHDLFNTKTPVVSQQAVLLNGLGTGKVFRFEPQTQEVIELFTAADSPDIAHTQDRLFVNDFTFVEGNMIARLREYNITLNPFTWSKGPDYLMEGVVNGPGLHAVSNTNLYMAGSTVNEINITGGNAVATPVFGLPAGYKCTGDLIYDPATQLFLITYDNSTDYKIGVFQRNGTLVRSAAAPVNNLYGMYQFEGSTYVVDGTGQIYSLNLSTLATTPSIDTNVANAGASQIQSNISIPA